MSFVMLARYYGNKAVLSFEPEWLYRFRRRIALGYGWIYAIDKLIKGV